MNNVADEVFLVKMRSNVGFRLIRSSNTFVIPLSEKNYRIFFSHFSAFFLFVSFFSRFFYFPAIWPFSHFRFYSQRESNGNSIQCWGQGRDQERRYTSSLIKPKILYNLKKFPKNPQ